MINLKKNEQELTNEVMNKISLSKDKAKLEKHVVNLSKCVVDLSKKVDIDLGGIKAKVVLVLDYSGSMSNLYRNGTVQETINRLVPLGLTFDDNGSIDAYLFKTDYRKFDDITLGNYEDYVNKVIDKSGYRMGGTKYSPVLNAIITNENGKSNGGVLSKLFSSKNNSEKKGNEDEITFVLFITDGENSDSSATDEVIRESAKKKYKTFIQFIGIGDEKFKYLRKLDDLDDREADNTGFSKMQDLKRASDKELYNNVLGQFAEWLKLI